MSDFEVWWLLIAVPLLNVFGEAWNGLLQTRSEQERQEIITQAGATALVNTILAIAIAVAPWPWKLLGLVPLVFPVVGRALAEYFHIYLSFRYRQR